MLVALGAWAYIAGGAVWLLVILVMLCMTAGWRLVMQAELERASRPLEEDLRGLKTRLQVAATAAPATANGPVCQAESEKILQQRIAQLEAEMRLLCPAERRQNPPQDPPTRAAACSAD